MSTKDNPTCYHGALNYLSGLTGKPRKIEVEFKSIESLRGRNGKLKYRAYDVFVVKDGITYGYPQKGQIKGGEWVYRVGGITLPINTKWDRVYAVVDRPIDDFGVPVISCGTYKDSLGGGWHSNVPLCRVNDFYFAYMECSC